MLAGDGVIALAAQYRGLVLQMGWVCWQLVVCLLDALGCWLLALIKLALVLLLVLLVCICCCYRCCLVVLVVATIIHSSSIVIRWAVSCGPIDAGPAWCIAGVSRLCWRCVGWWTVG